MDWCSTLAQRPLRRLCGAGRSANAGFSLIEVVFAAVIMAVGFAAAAICLRLGVDRLDAARRMALVSQVLQDEAERLRLENWNHLADLPATERLEQSIPAVFRESILGEMVNNGDLTIERTITDVSGMDGLKHIRLEAIWRGLDGQPRTRIYQLHYARGGVSDYYYGTRDE